MLALAGCVQAPVAPIPDPFPETLAWAAHSTLPGAFLGVRVRENDSGSLDALAFEPGVRVTQVVDNSPALGAGIAVGDVLLRWDGRAVNDPRDLELTLREATPGALVRLALQRGDTVFDVSITLQASAGPPGEAPEVLYRRDPVRSRAGWLGGRGGVVLVSSALDAPFPSAGVGVGSVVLALDAEPVRSERELIRRLLTCEPGARVEVDFLDPQGEPRSARVRLHETPTKVIEFSIPILFTYRGDVTGEETRFVLIDLYLISLVRYRREGSERRWSLLRFFAFSSGIGELTE